eukprot:TRINITY_DN44148_c0_g1_i1.p1 TRINITY_DN44148_c0_g1~~TRINITY_DN44148_c0_g1_i1.p1  ORF type:complete len:484 (-),score=65.86 TRINITY_DN44148_c0_g1_i1:82-1473(-)
MAPRPLANLVAELLPWTTGGVADGTGVTGNNAFHTTKNDSSSIFCEFGSNVGTKVARCRGNYSLPTATVPKFHSSLLSCPNDPKPKAFTGVAPACLDSGGDCADPAEFAKLREFSKAVDNSVEEALKDTTKYRHIFERRVNDFKYAELREDKSSKLAALYGPHGPFRPGGSYLFAMRRWVEALHRLKRACYEGIGGCNSLISYLRDHPEDDITTDGFHGKAGSKVYNELRLACEVGRTRSPLPNGSPVWCSESTKLCEQKSGRQWWREAKGKRIQGVVKDPGPWVDDRSEYDDLKDACGWISFHRPSAVELDRFQRKLQRDTDREKEQYCSPRWVEGYCAPQTGHEFGECHLPGGRFCRRGIVSPGSNLNHTAAWAEEFPNSPLQHQSVPSVAWIFADIGSSTAFAVQSTCPRATSDQTVVVSNGNIVSLNICRQRVIAGIWQDRRVKDPLPSDALERFRNFL